VQHILGILLMAWYFLTPVLFSVQIVADRPTERELLYLNPIAAIVVSYQRALLDGVPPEWTRLAYSAVFAVAVLLLGFNYFRCSKRDFEEAL
jgi:ABC-2 type transport system permease protein